MQNGLSWEAVKAGKSRVPREFTTWSGIGVPKPEFSDSLPVASSGLFSVEAGKPETSDAAVAELWVTEMEARESRLLVPGLPKSLAPDSCPAQ
jgi:hypothetical protein